LKVRTATISTEYNRNVIRKFMRKLKATWEVVMPQVYHGEALDSELTEQFRKKVDSEVITELVKQSLQANPPEDEMDEFNALVGIQHRPQRAVPPKEDATELPRAVRRINLLNRRG
jgi:hypothetical protein